MECRLTVALLTTHWGRCQHGQAGTPSRSPLPPNSKGRVKMSKENRPALPGPMVLHLPTVPSTMLGTWAAVCSGADCHLHEGAHEDWNPSVFVLPKSCALRPGTGPCGPRGRGFFIEMALSVLGTLGNWCPAIGTLHCACIHLRIVVPRRVRAQYLILSVAPTIFKLIKIAGNINCRLTVSRAGPGVGWGRRGVWVQNARRLPPQGWAGADGHLRVSASLHFAPKVPGARHFIYIVSIFSFSSPHYSPIIQIK